MALVQIEKHFGKGSIMRVGEHTAVGVEAISTGALSLDLALGICGLPRGRGGATFARPPPRQATANRNRSRTICIFINQLREKIGIVCGTPETTPGGRALKFYASVRL